MTEYGRRIFLHCQIVKLALSFYLRVCLAERFLHLGFGDGAGRAFQGYTLVRYTNKAGIRLQRMGDSPLKHPDLSEFY